MHHLYDHAVKFEKLSTDRFSWRTRTEFERSIIIAKDGKLDKDKKPL